LESIQLRRRDLLGAAVGLSFSAALSAAERLVTPPQAMGPFYPIELPLDQDNDLTRVAGQSGRAFGPLLDVIGRVLDEAGVPVSGLRLEIWQVNGHGRFQGFGHTLTAADGSYRFRTIKPVTYPGRAPHIHFALVGRSQRRFYTQMYLAGAPENRDDFLLRRLSAAGQRALVVPLSPGADQTLQGSFDIVLGKTVLSDRA